MIMNIGKIKITVTMTVIHTLCRLPMLIDDTGDATDFGLIPSLPLAIEALLIDSTPECIFCTLGTTVRVFITCTQRHNTRPCCNLIKMN